MKAAKIAMQLLAMGMGSPDQIAQATGLTLEEVQKLAQKQQTTD